MDARVDSLVTLRMISPALVGREDESAALDAIFNEVQAGVGRTVVVGGDAGIGKSRLVSSFLVRARAAGAQIGRAQCLEVEAGRPFGPFFEALQNLNVVPRIEASGPGSGAVDPDARYRTLRIFSAAFSDLARKGPLVIAIYAVAAIGVSAAALSLLPASASRWPLPALGAIALAAWLVGPLALLLAFGLPLTSS